MELQEILAQMKVLALEFEVSRIHLTWTSYDQAFAFTHPKRALALLQQQPQIGFAVYVGFAASGIISSSSLQQLLDTAKAPVAYSPTSQPSALNTRLINQHLIAPISTHPVFSPPTLALPTTAYTPTSPYYYRTPPTQGLYSYLPPAQQYGQPPIILPSQLPAQASDFTLKSGDAEKERASHVIDFSELNSSAIDGSRSLSAHNRAAIEYLRSKIAF